MARGMWEGLLGSYGDLRQMKQQDIQNNRETRRLEREDRRQEIWLEQQQRVQEEYDRLAKQRKANFAAVMHPGLVKKYMESGGDVQLGPVASEDDIIMQKILGADPNLIYKVGTAVDPRVKFARALALKRAGRENTGKPLSTFTADGRRLQPRLVDGKWVNVDVGKAPENKGVTVSLNDKRPSAFATSMGQEGAKRYSSFLKQKEEAAALMTKLRYVMNSDSKAGGTGSDLMLNIKSFLNNMGVPIDVKEDEMLRSLGNQFAIAARGGAFSGGKPLTGNTSDADMDRLMAAVPGLRQSPEGRKMIAEMLYRVAKFNYDRGVDIQDKYRKQGGAFDPMAYRYEDPNANDDFHELSLRAEALAGKTQGGDPATTGGGASSTNGGVPLRRRYDPKTRSFIQVK